MGASKLSPDEQACIREAADTLLFCRDVDQEDASDALAAVAVLTDDLIDAERWTLLRAQQLLDDVWACGPGVALGVGVAA
jgi:hypothetical protein